MLVALLMIILGTAAMFAFVYPTRAAVDQQRRIENAKERIAVLSKETEKLKEERERLKQDDEIERIAREKYGYVEPGEDSYQVTPGSTTVPDTGSSDLP